MPTLFTIVARYFWLICISVNCVNGFVWWRRVQPAVAKSPQLGAGYRRLIKGWIVYGNIPWVVMGIGVVYGGVPGVFHYFNARNGPFVIAWYLSLVAVWILAGWWLFAKRRAEELVEHPGLFNMPFGRPAHIKALFLLALLGGVVALCVFIFGNIDLK